MLLLVILFAIKLLSQVSYLNIKWFLFLKKALSNFRFIDLFGFTCDFNFALANEVENINNDDGTFVDSELVNTDIVNSANNKNSDIDNVNSLNIINNYCVNNFYCSRQIDACNSNNTDHETSGDNYDSQEDDWLQKQYKWWVFLFVSFFILESSFSQISGSILSIIQWHCVKRASIFYLSVNQQDPDYDSCEESSFSDEESESDFEEFICPLSPSLKYPSDERVFVVYESKLRELLTSCTKRGYKINHNLIREGKNTGSQLTLHIECEKDNSLHLISILGKLLQI